MALAPSLGKVKSLWTDYLGKLPLVCPAYDMKGGGLANGLGWEVQEFSEKLSAAPSLVQACNIFSNLAFNHPAPQRPILFSIPHLFGAQIYDLKQKQPGRAQHRGDPKFPKLTQNREPSAPANPSHSLFIKSHMRHLLLTALSGALPSRLPVKDRRESLPDQAAAEVHRGAQEAPEQEAEHLCVLRRPLQAQVPALL